MSKQLTDTQRAKLPKYAQEYIRNIERERACALECLRRTLDDQTPSKVKTTSFESIGEQPGPSLLTRYFQVEGGSVEITHKGVTLTVSGFYNESNDMQLSWRTEGGLSGLAIAFVPTAYQQARLVNLAYDPNEFYRLKDEKRRCENG